MRTVRIGLSDVELAGAAWTALAWHEAFGREDGTDVFDACASVEASLSGEGDAVRVPIYDSLRLAYALAATAARRDGSKIPPFDEWVLSLGRVDTKAWVGDVLSEVSAGLFLENAADARDAG